MGGELVIVAIHTAPAVVPVVGETVADGAVAVAGDRIVAVGRRDEVLAAVTDDGCRFEVVDWEGVIVPGLVNAHTHLQYTSFDVVGADRHDTYVRWAERFVAEYATRPDEDWRATARAGVEAGLAAGTTCFGDVVTDRVAMDVLVEADVAGVAYFEIIGVDHERWRDEVIDEVTEVVDAAVTTRFARVGLSPHAPYSVTPDAMRSAVAWARQRGLRLHSHVAEIGAEDELYRTGTGWWAERLRVVSRRPSPFIEAGGWGVGVAEVAEATGLIGPDVHLAHGVYLDPAGRRRFADAGTIVALCPRSNRTVGSEPPPVAEYLRERVPFAVGTDSLGSTHSLDLLADLAMLRSLAIDAGYTEADLDARLLAAATVVGAGSLGLADQVGALTPGRRADLAVFAVDPADPVTSVVRDGAGRCLAVLVGGQPRRRRTTVNGTLDPDHSTSGKAV